LIQVFDLSKLTYKKESRNQPCALKKLTQ
jgi:hypothetical protein